MANKFAVITGASSGIGFELARVFGQNGYDLLINSSGERLESAASELKSLGFAVTAVQADYQLMKASSNSGAKSRAPVAQWTRLR